MISTLILSATGGDIGISVLKILKNAGFRVIALDMNPSSVAKNYADAFYIVPSAKSDEYTNVTINIARKENADSFMPISEPEIIRVNKDRGIFRKSGIKTAINNSFIVETFSDKLKTSLFLAEIGLNVPGTCLLTDYTSEFSFPFIVKDRLGCGNKTVKLIEHETDLQYIIHKNTKGTLIAQEYIDVEDAEYTTGIFSDGSRISTVSFKRTLGYGGLSRCVELVCEPELEKIAKKIAKSSKLRGSINLQTRRKNGIFYPFEINPRISSTVAFRTYIGFNDPCWWIKILNGGKYEYNPKYKTGKGIKVLSEYYYDLEEI